MVIKQLSIGIGVIYVSSDDIFGLAFESNINISKPFYAAVAGVMKMTHRIIREGTSVSNKSLSINH